ncbi:MAG: two-component regulator propeller domain-containing protein [Candidatus Glassbacteria bacterium]
MTHRVYSLLLLFILTRAAAGHAESLFVNYGIFDGLVTDVFKCVAIDSKGIVWVGSKGFGANSFDGKKWTKYEATSTPVDYASIRYITIDSRNLIWFATTFGVHRYDGTIWSSVLPAADSYRVAEDRQGRFWVATKDGLFASKGATWTLYTKANGLPDDTLSYVYADRQNVIWIGTKTQGLVRYDGTSFRKMDWPPAGTPAEIRVIQEDRRGRLWIGTRLKGAAVYDGTSFTAYDSLSGLNSSNVWGMAADSTGNMWFATYSGGVSMFDGLRWYNYTRADGLLQNWTDDVAVDRNGNLWVVSEGGISFLPRDNMKHFASCDINLDGRNNVLDVLALLQIILRNPADPRADRDGDGRANIQDVVALLREISGGGCP